MIKHHLYTNFTAYGLEEPTWINVAREPVSRFVSSYYFRRFGFARHEGVRNNRVKAGERAMEMVRIISDPWTARGRSVLVRESLIQQTYSIKSL